MRLYDIECAILATFFFHDRNYDDKPFTLNPDFFGYPFNKRVAEKIVETLQDNKSPSLVSYIIEDSVNGTNKEVDFHNIMASNPLTMRCAKQYHDYLKTEYLKRELKRL